MRKIIVLIVALLFIVDCSDDSTDDKGASETDNLETEKITLSDELEEFINIFNNEVDNIDDYEQDLPELEKIKKSDIDEPDSEGKGFKQSLLKFTFENNDGFYEILSIYGSDKELTGYRMVTQGPSSNDDTNLSLDDRGKMLGAVIADSLGLGIDEYYENLNSLLDENKESGSYSESDYKVIFDISPKERIVTVNFDKENEVAEEPEEEQTEDVSETEDVEVPEEKEEPDTTQYNISDIEYDVKNIVGEDLDNTTITDLRVNEDVSVDEERYIVLVDITWDVKNKPKTTKDMLDMYSDHLAVKIADNDLVYEIVLFWTVPYHNENDSILKRAYQNKDGGMFLENEMKDINVFD